MKQQFLKAGLCLCYRDGRRLERHPGIPGQGAPVSVTSHYTIEHQEEESSYRASELIQTDTENYPAEGSWHLGNELSTFANQWVGFFCI